MINQSASSVTINAQHINITGQNVADLINNADSSVVIQAAHIQLTGGIEINDLTSAAKASLISDVSAVTEYYLSTSDSTATGGSWSTTIPAWESGKYVWTRTKTTKTDASGAITTTETSETYDRNLTKALTDAAGAVATANTANTTANNANTTATTANKRATYHFATCSTAAGTAAKAASCTDFELFTGATMTVYFTNANTAANPTLNVNSTGAKPIYVKNAAIAAAFYWQAGDTVTFVYNGTNWIMAESSANSVIANWCYNNDKTYINGGNIYTGTVTTAKLAAKAVTAAKIDVDDLFAQSITATNFKITGGSIEIEAAADSTSYIDLYRNLTAGVGLRTQISAQTVRKVGYYNGQQQAAAQLGSTGLGIYDASNTRTAFLGDTISIPGKATLGALNSGLFTIKQVTVLNQQSLAGDGYAGATVTFSPDSGYTAIAVVGWAVTTTDGGNYARYMNVWALRLSSATEIYYSICNTGTNTRTVTLYAYVLQLKTTA